MKFRADIEGLRGIAVLLVVLAHAGVPGFAGGFIGVDVFFVISGYLITGLLSQEVERTGTLDYWAFYSRRVRRLAPALLVMLVVVLGLCLAYMPRALVSTQLQAGAWAAVWLSNFHFAFSQYDYFGATAQESLVLHTWSLGVEEQFYLLWPLMVVMAARFWRSQRAWLVWAVALSFGLSLVLMPLDAAGAYYLMPSRLWQLALGGLVYRWLEANPPIARGRFGAGLGGAGLVLLATSMLLIDGTVAYPGYWAALPAISAALLLAGGSDAGNPVSRVVASPMLRLPGRISYSWYLWHWPIFVIGPLLGLWRLEGIQSLAVILISFLVGWLSCAWVEEPFRHRAAGSPRTVVLVSILVSVALAALLQFAAVRTVVTPAEALAEQTLSQRVRSMISVPSVYDDGRCDQWYFSSELVPCDIETGGGGNGTILLIADSIGTQWAPALEQAARARGMRLQVLTKSACPIVDEPFVYERIHRRYTECETWRERAMAYAAEVRPEMVVIGSATYGFSRTQWIEGSQRLLRRLRAATGQVVVLAPTPALPFHGPRCLLTHAKEVPGGLEVQGCTSELAASENREVLSALKEAVAGVPGTHLLYMNDGVCPQGVCRAFHEGRLNFRDEQHLNADLVASLGPEFARRLPPSVATPSER